MNKIYEMPTVQQASTDLTSSINFIVLQLAHYLPEFGYEVTPDIAAADLVVGHAGATYDGHPCHVTHCHGLYPTALFHDNRWHFEANANVLNNLRESSAITVPSQWVGEIIQRDMGRFPTVVPWGISASSWKRDKDGGYVLWNKTRADHVCDPTPVSELAGRSKQTLFMTTFLNTDPTPNIKVTGRMKREMMKTVIEQCSVYLATTKETFGIGILEAMAVGVPILGFRWGALPDIVTHGETGYLVEPGDYDGLHEGLEYCLKHAAVLGRNAKEAVRQYTWENVARQMAQVYDRVLQPPDPIRVSIVIPVYNYAHYLPVAINSAIGQNTSFDYEVIVVDDCSTDNSHELAMRMLEGFPNGLVLKTEQNSGVATARNTGIEFADGEYIVCLDADDALAQENTLETLYQAIQSDPKLGIVYGALQNMRADGSLGRISDWPEAFDYSRQVQARNCIPTCNMFRKQAWYEAGGYRQYCEPAEDAELWLRITTNGWGAQKVTSLPTLYYRWHEHSLSAPIRMQREKEPNWTKYHPYTKDRHYPFAALADPEFKSHPVPNYDTPLVSVVIPVGAGHERSVTWALDSIQGQTERRWECIVVNDTGKPLSLRGYAWVRVVECTRHNAGAARNEGVRHARSPYIAFLDADDYAEPEWLENCLTYFSLSGKYPYCDWHSINKEGIQEHHATPGYDPNLVFKQTSLHSINVLLPRTVFWEVGGFSETMPAWEDVDFFMRLAKHGFCGIRIPKPLITYRYSTGNLRERGETIKTKLIDYLRQVFGAYIRGEVMCSCNNKPPKPSKPATSANGMSAQSADGMIRVQYQGASAMTSLYGAITRTYYGQRMKGDTFYVYQQDANALPDLFTPVGEIEAVIMSTPVPNAPQPA